MRSHNSYMAELIAAGVPVSPIWKIACLRHGGVAIDTLHAIDQGLSCHIVANVFVDVMDQGAFGDVRAEQLTNLKADLNRWYKANKQAHRIQGELTLSRVKTQGDWPKLKCKAAAARHLVAYAYDLAARFD